MLGCFCKEVAKGGRRNFNPQFIPPFRTISSSEGGKPFPTRISPKVGKSQHFSLENILFRFVKPSWMFYSSSSVFLSVTLGWA